MCVYKYKSVALIIEVTQLAIFTMTDEIDYEMDKARLHGRTHHSNEPQQYSILIYARRTHFDSERYYVCADSSLRFLLSSERQPGTPRNVAASAFSQVHQCHLATRCRLRKWATRNTLKRQCSQTRLSITLSFRGPKDFSPLKVAAFSGSSAEII